ncbi:hypothetical protein QF026_001427 [Streptomyces aurantiacus]|nr:hypothetical protein [Streptomyces aurantiacus]
MPSPTPPPTDRGPATTRWAGRPVGHPPDSSQCAATATATAHVPSAPAGPESAEEPQRLALARPGSTPEAGTGHPAPLRQCTCTRTTPRTPPAADPPPAPPPAAQSRNTRPPEPPPPRRPAGPHTLLAPPPAGTGSRCADRSSPPDSGPGSGSSALPGRRGCFRCHPNFRCPRKARGRRAEVHGHGHLTPRPARSLEAGSESIPPIPIRPRPSPSLRPRPLPQATDRRSPLIASA